jgi:hypothetical protein
MPIALILPLIQTGLELAKTILDGIPPKQRAATALAWFWAWWPLMKIAIPPEQAAMIETEMKKATIGG